LTAATGIDALSHAIESALSKIATPLTHALALESIRLISNSLRAATLDGSNLEARTTMAWATLMEGFSESNAGDVEGHAVAHLLGGYYQVHHGEACGIALPYCMKHNLPVNTPILARIAKAMDEDLTGTQGELAEKGILAVQELIQEVGAPGSIADIKEASKADIPELVALYCTHPDITEILELFAKRGVPSEAEATEFFEEMFEPFSLASRSPV
jgi:alcohol dehydrogenase